MALDKLLEQEAQSEIERIRAEARDRSQMIVAQAQERAQALIESRQRALETQRQAGIVRARSAADLDLNAARLTASESGMSQVYELVNQQITEITRVPEYRDILGRLIYQAREVITDAEAVEVNPAEAALARELVHDIAVRENPAIQGGVRVVARGGKSGITNTLAGRLERVRGELAPQVSRLLAE
ncbi:V-type ATP synthase subunit E [Deinococcus deserti]|uniref:V-type proton ATPase subunit E n=1 Tax=Deinococcus deserti (strain DSM 17065 / CIP 109153 / LMG 22923 / VCD115) TaxID=546414 RepID=VATE_DEIDV|nr:V-type ATP synthase subunit E [Deinococcus deserti]C1CXU0.1 RecName: Full=V-type proton ATPase subunit E; AltName: Full=V-ATPase subunit E [Deinococcus deserti VCD115]ACO44896.1 putative V-type ATP synthase subunit E [Deinococcus deserti VCD115]